MRSLRPSRVFLASLAAANLLSAAGAQLVAMTVVMDGAQEVPPVATSAKGTAYGIVDRSANTLTYALCFDALSAAQTAGHIHGFAAPGASGGVLFALPLGSFQQGGWNYSEAQESDLLDGLCYLNIHSSAFGGGEIRGQILRSSADATLTLTADGAQVVPPTASTGRGVGWFRFDTLANSMAYSFTMTGLPAAEDSTHIHGFAPPGVATNTIKFTLPLGNHKNGTLFYPGAQEANYLAGLAYVNVHVAPNGDDEIRGQMQPAATNPTSYCSSKLNSQGCSALVAWTGSPTLTGADDFHVTCSQVINQKSGILYWGFAPRNVPFAGGTQCVQSPVIRTPVQSSGGNPPPDDCSGTFDFHFTDAYMAARGLSAGQSVFCEYWYRDPVDPAHVGLSNALAAEIVP